MSIKIPRKPGARRRHSKLVKLTAENILRIDKGLPMKKLRGRLGWYIPSVGERPPLQDIHPALYRSEEVEGMRLITAVTGRSWEKLLAHIPNGGGRSKAEAGKLKAQGVRTGWSDYLLAKPAHGKFGLWIELKASDGKESDDQLKHLVAMHNLGYAACFAYGADAAFSAIDAYLCGRWPA